MLVGREAELRRIRGWLGEPLSPGQLRMIQVEGPMGIGKSTVLADVLSRLGPSPHQAAGAPRWQSFLVHGGRWHGEAPLAAHRVLIEQVLGAQIEELLAEATAATLGARCAERLGAAGGSIVVAVDELPKSLIGKVLRRKVRDALIADRTAVRVPSAGA